MRLTAAQTDRAAGVLLGAAIGDALGAGYEFGSAHLTPDERPSMIGGGLGGFAPGEWTDDTAQTYALAEVAATGADLRTQEAQDLFARRLWEWYDDGPPDIGILTSQVLSEAGRRPSAQTLRSVAADVFLRNGHAAGNGALMRTSPVALACLDHPEAMAEAAMSLSSLTHGDPLAGEACVLWCAAIREAVLNGAWDVRVGLRLLPRESRRLWSERVDAAERRTPGDFQPNGFVVTALQAAWSAIHYTAVPDPFPSEHVRDALTTAIRIGDDTDTVASIAGALLGARWGSSAFPAEWRSLVHGWPGRTAPDLMSLAILTVNGGRPDRLGWPGVEHIDYSGFPGETPVPHPHDPGVLLSGARALDALPPSVTAVVSLCRVGTAQVPNRVAHVDFRLLDTTADDNPNLGFVIDDAARTIERLRDEGHVVLLHCAAGQSRTPAVAARYAMLKEGLGARQALTEVCNALPSAAPNLAFGVALEELGERDQAVRGSSAAQSHAHEDDQRAERFAVGLDPGDDPGTS